MHGMQILITGITGFIGTHLTRILKQTFPSCHISGIGRFNSEKHQKNFNYYAINLLHPEELFEFIKNLQPEYIFHLSGVVFSYVWDDLYTGNVTATLNLLEAIRKANINTHVIMVGSAAEYGVVPVESLPVSESYVSMPKSPYGMTKLWQTMLAKYHNSRECPVTIARIFNVLSSGTPVNLTTGDLFSQLMNLSQPRQKSPIVVGNLAIKRDFLDVIDVCLTLIALAKRGHPGEIYNICSGVSVAVNDILDLALSLLEVDVDVVIDETKSQNIYVEDLYGCNAKIKKDTGWNVTITKEESIKRILGIHGVPVPHE